MASRQKRANFLVRYALRSVAFVLIFGILLRIFMFSSFVMSGVSMLPSIWPGDFLLAAKWRVRDLRLGEIVAFRCIHDKDQICLKRVVALPGDRVEYQQGILTINRDQAVYEKLSDGTSSESVGGVHWTVWPETTGSPKKMDPEPIIVPPQHVFLLNDKRENWDDSRSWGAIKTDLIEARALRVWLSLDWFEGDEVRSWPRVRAERMFRSID